MIKPKFSLIPQFSFKNITDLTTDFLTKHDIRFLMLDLDNTIAAYNEQIFSTDIYEWLIEMRSGGTELFLISNSTRTKRVESFAGSIGIDFIMRSCKPSPKSLLRAMEIKGFSSDVSALAGDQIYTDALAANRAGIISVIIKPRRFTNPLLALRYFTEVPFRALCKNKFNGV